MCVPSPSQKHARAAVHERGQRVLTLSLSRVDPLAISDAEDDPHVFLGVSIGGLGVSVVQVQSPALPCASSPFSAPFSGHFSVAVPLRRAMRASDLFHARL